MAAVDVFSPIVEKAIHEGFFPGAVLRIERGGSLLFEGAFGDAVVGGASRTPMTTGTFFDLASLTKLFTTTAILRLVTTGALALDTKLEALAGEPFSIFGRREAARTRLVAALGRLELSRLLDHSSGIHYWFPFYARKPEPFEVVLAEVVGKHPLEDATIYSDLNFMLLGRVIEAVTGKDIAEAVGELVVGPLGLERSLWRAPAGAAAATDFGNRIEEGMVADLGLSFEGWRDSRLPVVGEPNDGNCHYYFGDAAGHAGIFSDARDLCRLGRLYLEGGIVDGRPHLERDLAAEALRDRGRGRGLGFQLGDNYPGRGAGHTGFTGTYLHVNPATGLVIVLLANRLHTEPVRDINPVRRAVSEAALARFGRPA